MTFADDFADLLPDSVTVELASTTNGYGENGYSAGFVVPGRLMRKASARRDRDKIEFSSPMHVILDTVTLIPLDSRVTVPGDPSSPHIVRDVEVYRDENNDLHHTTVYFAD